MIHRQILHNGKIVDAAEPCLHAGQLGLLAGFGVFSTLLVEDSCLFAWDRHWRRMTTDAALLNVPMPADPDAVEADLLRLIEANAGQHAGRCTLRIVVVRNTGGVWEGPGTGQPSDLIALTSSLKQWPDSVRLDVQPHGRYAAGEFCRVKSLSWAQNLRWAERAAQNGFDETVLLNERNLVAECTSANIFAAFGNEVVTPPLTDGCLPGVTREVLLTEVNVPGVEIRERSVSVDNLRMADELFITSSTRELLSVRELAGQAVRTAPSAGSIRARLSMAFGEYIRKDIGARKKAAFAA